MRFTYRAAAPIAAAAFLGLLAGCSRTQRDWRVAQQADTAQAYTVFVQRHPDSELAGVARQRIAQLSEQMAWQQAARLNTVASYRDYLARYPSGTWSQDARIRMESLSLGGQKQSSAATSMPASAVAAAPSPEPTVSSAASEPATYSEAPTPPVARVATPAAPSPVAYTASRSGRAAPRRSRAAGFAAVQLGAFSTSSNAHRAWRELFSRFGRELRGLTPQVTPVRLSSGRLLYRLQARVRSAAAAKALCQRLGRRFRDCLPVP